MAGDALELTCNICGMAARAEPSRLGRETASCDGCGSTVRQRSLVHCLSTRLFGESLAVADFPPAEAGRSGVGLSDWPPLAEALADQLDYRNTFLHTEPRLDICSPPEAWLGRFDFLIASEVFEHVTPPVSRAFDGARDLLAPGGIIVLTVPWADLRRAEDGRSVMAAALEHHEFVEVDGRELLLAHFPNGHVAAFAEQTIEHFPDLVEHRLVQLGTESYLVYTRADGSVAWRRDLVFHGGPGETLEMRVFGRQGLIDELERAGFVDIEIHSEPEPRFGVIHQGTWSLPVTARRPDEQAD